jgi:hypothetical protein
MNLALNKKLSIIAIGYSNGRVGIINWPFIKQEIPFKYEIFL